MRTAKTLIRLGGCPGLSESSPGVVYLVGFVMLKLNYNSILARQKLL